MTHLQLSGRFAFARLEPLLRAQDVPAWGRGPENAPSTPSPRDPVEHPPQLPPPLRVERPHVRDPAEQMRPEILDAPPVLPARPISRTMVEDRLQLVVILARDVRPLVHDH